MGNSPGRAIIVLNRGLVLDAGCLVLRTVVFVLDFILVAVKGSLAKNSGNVDICVLAVIAFRTGQADMAFRTILAIHSTDGDAIIAVFVFHGNAIFAIFARFAIMADDHRGSLTGFDGEFAVLARCTRLARFALLADGQLVVELDVVDCFSTRRIFFSSNQQIVISTDIITVISCTHFI